MMSADSFFDDVGPVPLLASNSGERGKILKNHC